LQSVGVRFGADLNAYTSFDETIYTLLLPTDKPDILEKGFVVLSDWAHNLTFDSTEIRKERGVVIEEWRLGRGAEQRMRDKYLPMIFHNSRYAERLPIGTKKSLETFKDSSLKRFYKDWYRPDLMGVVVVGDLSVKEAELLIKKNFADIPAPNKPRERKIYNVPDHPETFISINTDKEASTTNIMIFYKTNHRPEITIADFKPYYIQLLYFQMLNQRLGELEQQANPPFIGAYSYFGNIGARTKDAYVSLAMVSDTGIIRGLQTILEENEKVKRFGFSQSELDRAKKDLLNSFEIMYQERDKTESDKLADEYVRNFLIHEPIPGITFEYEYFKYLLPQITLGEMDSLAKAWIVDTNRVLVITAPNKPSVKIPSENEIRSEINKVENEKLQAYEDKLTSTDLMKEKPVGGTISNRKYFAEINTYFITLSNGVNVLLKPTPFKNDQILMSAFSPGGQFLYPDSDNFSASWAPEIVKESGIDGFSYIDLQKLLSGKEAVVRPNIGLYTEGLDGSSSPKDFETMMQLTFLYFTKPRIDTLAFISFISRYKAYLKNLLSNPQNYYSDQLAHILSQNHPRGEYPPTPSDLDKIRLSSAFRIYKDRFADASDFTFVLVGSFKVDSIIPFIETYLGSLPDIHRKETWRDIGIRPPKGSVYKKIFKGSDPKSRVTMVFTDSSKYDEKDAYYLQSLADFMNIRLIEVLREEKGGVYGVKASASMTRIPYSSYRIKIQFACAPENVDSLVNDALEIIKEIKQKGVSKDYLNKIKETQRREFQVSVNTNEYWLGYLQNQWFYHENMNQVNQSLKEIIHLKSRDIQKVANKYFKKDYIEVVLYPEK
jgi:zinc protease